MAVNLKHSSVLFTDDDGSPLVFQLWPCIERKNLRLLIEHGGGSITSKGTDKSIKLAALESKVKSSDYISTRYVHDCVQQNKLLDMSLYRMDMHLDDEDLNHANLIIKTVSRDRKGRKKFTLAEDNKIIKYLMEERRYTEMRGNAVWKDMEILKITNHTHQSMKDRFRKTILPNIHQYSMPKSWVSALTGNICDSRSSPGSTSSRMSSRLSALSPSLVKERLSFPLQPLQSTPVTNRSCRTGENEAQNEETMDISDDDFDKELYKMSVPEKGDGAICDDLSIIQPISQKDMDLGSPVVERVKTRSVEKNLESPVNDTVTHITRSSISTVGNSRLIKSQPNTGTEKSEVNICKTTTTTPVSNRESCAQKRRMVVDDRTENCNSSQVSAASPRRERKQSPQKGRSSSPRNAQSQRKQKRSSDKDGTDGGMLSGCTALTDFIMNSHDTENSQESLTSSDEGNNLGTDLEDCAGPREVKKHCQIIKVKCVEDLVYVALSTHSPHVSRHIPVTFCIFIQKLCGHFNLGPSAVLEALWANSGSLRNTVHWIHHGRDVSGRPAWTEEDDRILQSASTEDINALRRKYGCEKVDQRAAFLEDSCFKE